VLLNILMRLAEAAFQRQTEAGRFEGFGGRKLHRPEVGVGLDKRQAINVAARLAANLPDEADDRLLPGARQAQGHEFVGCKAVS